MIAWDAVVDDFVSDGSLRDIYVLGTSLEVWRVALGWIRDAFSGELTRDGEPLAWPTDVAELFRRDASWNFNFDIGGLDLACHFFSEDEIEFDLLPSLVNAETFPVLLEFMRDLAGRTGQIVILTPENCPEWPSFRVNPAGVTEHLKR